MGPSIALAARLSAALFCLTALALPASVLASGREGGPYSDFRFVAPAAIQYKDLSVSTATPTPNNDAEMASFWEKLRTGTIEPACRKLEIKVKQNIKIVEGVAGFEGAPRRAIKKFPDGNLAMVDEIGLKLNVGYGRSLLSLPDMQGLGVSASVSGSFEGKSQVVQPLPKRKMCGELLDYASLWEFKTVIPATKKRIRNMEVGEIWKLPLAMTFGFSVGASANIQQVVTVGVSYGMSRQKKPSITLRRLEQNKLRLRLRLDKISVRSFGVSANTVEVPLDALGLEQAGTMTADLLNRYAVPRFAERWVTSEMFDKMLKSEINKYITVKLSFAHSRYRGGKLLLEFILDPENEVQMENLAEFLRGNFGLINRFREMGISFRDFSEDDDALYGLEALDNTASEMGEDLGTDDTFAGTDMYNGRSNSVGANLGIIGNHSASWGSSYHRYQAADNGGETIHVHQRTRSYNGSNFNIPFLGTMIKHNSQRDVLVLNTEAVDGTVTRPVMLYQQYEGVVGQGSGAVERMLEHANGMLRYVGVAGTGTDASNQLPVSDIIGDSRRFKSGVMGFKLLISERGIGDILAAPAESVMRAYMNLMRETYADIIDKVMHLFRITPDGKVGVLGEQARAALADTPALADGTSPLEVLNNLMYGATLFLKDLFKVREETDWKAQSQRLTDMAGGKGRSGLKYEDFFKVVLQLVRPTDVSAQVTVHLDPKKKGAANVSQTYSFYASDGKGYDATLSDVTRMRERFADPAELSD